MELLIPSWSPEDYSFKPTTADDDKITNNRQQQQQQQQQDLLNNNNSSNHDDDINGSSIDGILSNAVGSDSRNSFDDSTINKFLQDTLQLFRRKKEPSVVDSTAGRSEEKTKAKTKIGPRIFGKAASFRNVFGDRRTSRETSVESEGGKPVARKLSFGSRNSEARNWLREKLFGKVGGDDDDGGDDNCGDDYDAGGDGDDGDDDYDVGDGGGDDDGDDKYDDDYDAGGDDDDEDDSTVLTTLEIYS